MKSWPDEALQHKCIKITHFVKGKEKCNFLLIPRTSNWKAVQQYKLQYFTSQIIRTCGNIIILCAEPCFDLFQASYKDLHQLILRKGIFTGSHITSFVTSGLKNEYSHEFHLSLLGHYFRTKTKHSLSTVIHIKICFPLVCSGESL